MSESFAAAWDEGVGRFGGDPVTVGAGLAVVHHKEDLRFALNQARRAESMAKETGRDCAGAGDLPTLGRAYHGRRPLGSDRSARDVDRAVPPGKWRRGRRRGLGPLADTLRAELPTLQGLPKEAVEAEVRRLAGRAEDRERRIDPSEAVDLLRDYRDAVKKRQDRPDSAILGDFVTMGQAASFLARGRD